MWWVAVGPIAGLILAAILAVVVPPVSRTRNARRAQHEGALWVGLANMNPIDGAQAPVGQAALSDVGPLYGSGFSVWGPRNRPVGGLLWLFPDRITWEPRIWLGRGKAHSWTIAVRDLRSVEIQKLALPALRTYRAIFETPEGPISFLAIDPDGLAAAIRLYGGVIVLHRR
jgi:hypothetical protein